MASMMEAALPTQPSCCAAGFRPDLRRVRVNPRPSRLLCQLPSAADLPPGELTWKMCLPWT